MARSHGRAAAAVALCAGLLFVNQLVAFVGSSMMSKNQLRSRVSLAASKAEIAAAQQKAQLLTWAANKMAIDGSPEADRMSARAILAEAEYEALKKGKVAPVAPPPVATAPVAAAPAPVAASPVATPSTVSKADLEAAKKKAQLLTWAASKLAADGSPEAPAMQARAAMAEAEFEALKKGQAAPAAAPVPVAAAPVAAAPVAAAPAPVAIPSTATKADLAAAEKKAQLLTWAAAKVGAQGSPEAMAMQAKADAAVAEVTALKKALMVA